jgi:hypothetical protein
MLNKIFLQIEKVFPSSVDEISEETWNENIAFFYEQVSLLGDDFFKIIETNLSKRPLLESKRELLTWQWRPFMISICELRLRPKSSYYQRFGMPIPSPENESVHNPTGVEINFALHKGVFCHVEKKLIPPKLPITFGIWGFRERIAFLNLLKDHRWQVEKLLSNSDFEFFTARPFDNVEKYKGKDVFKKLELYAENTKDDENCFSITKNITENSSMNDVLSALFPLMILYDATLGYCLNKKADRDRIFQYTALTSKD